MEIQGPVCLGESKNSGALWSWTMGEFSWNDSFEEVKSQFHYIVMLVCICSSQTTRISGIIVDWRPCHPWRKLIWLKYFAERDNIWKASDHFNLKRSKLCNAWHCLGDSAIPRKFRRHCLGVHFPIRSARDSWKVLHLQPNLCSRKLWNSKQIAYFCMSIQQVFVIVFPGIVFSIIN